MESLIERLSDSVSSARTLEELARPMLEMLEVVTGLESTYLTTIDLDQGLQHILFARNVGAMNIPEGISVPWSDTLCRRALDEGRMYTDDVASCWGDSDAARDLGIRTYVSTPVKTDASGLFGTLCAASGTQRPLAPHAEAVLQLFAKLIGQQVERELLVVELRKANAELAARASTDSLTGLPNRRSLLDTLRRLLAQGERENRSVLVGFIDMDGFKKINDTHGHDIGDEFLSAMAGRLSASLRTSDVLARFGGDEFVVVGAGPAHDEAPRTAARALADRLGESTIGELRLNQTMLDYGGASVGVVAIDPRVTSAEEALRMADDAMYAVKRSRQAAASRAAMATGTAGAKEASPAA
ncbi:sensor domain-containing diguanylate cyclase [Variovorax sp. J22G73]|uniref:sensor domain-containing diguanylate cyclase n=1 Tax=unclassified Variovorax TaxID=663243 RepID=UPI000D5E3D72|nr:MULTISPECIES: sensor domain-containing diguanylate cyclase [unclassified Variovorax]MDM0003182.1 sensor domain-containing diguanylate cyclase [Variovorax sp. J22R203]MDM0097152.1 sensor domain-containing diguanylate cyclase [Variovorax sp. J22G73]